MPGLPTNAVERIMNVREIAEALGVSDRTVRRHAANIGLTENGKTTMLNMAQVTAIKQAIERSGRSDLDNVVQVQNATTALEIEEMTLKVISYHKAEADRLRAELHLAQPAIESHAALMRSDRNVSVTEACKFFGIHPRLEGFPYLRECGYLTTEDLPTQAALDAGYLTKRINVDRDGNTHEQAVVEIRQLETWRLRVVPQIRAWIRREA